MPVDEDVQELRQLVAVEQPLAEATGTSRSRLLEHLADGRAVDLDLAVAAGLGPQDRGDADGRHQPQPYRAALR